jgi:calcineurin-like phosphoesterase family protein
MLQLDPDKTWFTADLHLGHANIIKYCDRPWWKDKSAKPTKSDVAEMNESLIANWNAVVKPDDTVLDLGDLALHMQVGRAEELVRRLNGKHIFVMGNHDDLASAMHWPDLRRPFEEFEEGILEVQVSGQNIVLCHYPLREWRGAQKGAWHLHGHVHGLLPPFGKSVDVGVDNTYEVLVPGNAGGKPPIVGPGGLIAAQALYRPLSFAEVKAFMDARSVVPHAEFGGYILPSMEVAV